MAGWQRDEVRRILTLLALSLAVTLLGLAAAIDAASVLAAEATSSVRL